MFALFNEGGVKPQIVNNIAHCNFLIITMMNRKVYISWSGNESKNSFMISICNKVFYFLFCFVLFLFLFFFLLIENEKKSPVW